MLMRGGSGGARTLPRSSAAGQGAGAELRANWRYLLAAGMGLLFSIHMISFYMGGVLMPALDREFGWSRTQLSLPIMLMLIVSTAVSPLVGKAIDRFGERNTAAASLLMSLFVLAAIGRFPGGYGLYLGLTTLLALVSAGASNVTYISIVGRRFHRARGLAIGISMSVTGVTGALTPRLMMAVEQAYGWRACYDLLIILSLGALAILFLLLRDAPRPPASDEDRDAAPGDPSDQPGMTLAQARRTRNFWLLAIGLFGMSLGVTGFVPHFVPMLISQGVAPAAAASTAMLIGLFIIVGRLLTGTLLDHVFAPRIAAMFALCGVSGYVLLAAGVPHSAGIAAALVGLSIGAEIDVAGYMVARYFGVRHYASIYGAQFAIFTAGGIMSPVGMGLLYDAFGSYRVGFAVAAASVALVIPALLSLGRYPDWEGSAARPA